MGYMNTLGKEPLSDDGVPAFPCFCCGVCCARYQVRMTREEAEHIARELGLVWDSFRRDYLDASWPGHHTFLARHTDQGCVFLEPQPDGRAFFCRIQPFKPADCRAWQASLVKDDCREGLRHYWNLETDDRGEISADPSAQAEFRALLERLG